jgi:hypothetical protein
MHITIISDRFAREAETFDDPANLMKQVADLGYEPLEQAEALCACGEYVTIYKATDTDEIVAVQNPHQNHRVW